MLKRVAIIGGGPAGMSCALWLHHLKLRPFIIEQAGCLGGLQRSNPYINPWFLGSMDVTGDSLSDRFAAHIEREQISISTNSSIFHIERNEDGFTLHIISSGHITPTHADAVVIATGTRFRTSEAHLHIAGFNDIAHRISYLPIPTEQLEIYSEKKIAIIGGGDNAFETAAFLSGTASHIDLIARSQPRAQTGFQQKIEQLGQQEKCTLHTHSDIERFENMGNQVKITLSSGQSMIVDEVFSRTGYMPNSESLHELFATSSLNETLSRDDNGYLLIDARHRTSIAGIYAAGDIANPINPCVATAVGQGTIAARTIEHDFREMPHATSL